MVLWSSAFDDIFTYDIEAWQTYFAHLGMTAGNNGSWCW
jgi:hypothetical protein